MSRSANGHPKATDHGLRLAAAAGVVHDDEAFTSELHIFDMRCDIPGIAERVFYSCATVTIRLVGGFLD
jgi:hypothetical protein